MESQGIVIWARAGTGALILWCADNGGLVYVSDRRRVGDPHAALAVGDLVAFRVETVGAMRTGHDLRFRATGAGWIRAELGRAARAHSDAVTSPREDIGQLVRFGPGALDGIPRTPPANRRARNRNGAA